MIKILALDPARNTGWACGVAGEIPASGVHRLLKTGEPAERLTAAALIFLRDMIRAHRPDLIVREKQMDPSAQRSSDVVRSDMWIHGGFLAAADLYGVRMIDVPVQTWRKHFCGRSSAAPPRKRGAVRTASDRHRDRKETKLMTIDRAIMLGYVPKECADDNRADATGIWDYAAHVHGKAVPRELVLF